MRPWTSRTRRVLALPLVVLLASACGCGRGARLEGGLARLEPWGRATVGPVAFSPDGSLLAVSRWAAEPASDVDAVVIHSTATWEERFRIRVEWATPTVTAAVTALAFSKDGGLLAIAGAGGVAVHSGRDGALLRRIDEAFVDGLAISPDGRTLAVSCSDVPAARWQDAGIRALRLHDLGPGKPAAPRALISGSRETLPRLVFTEDGRGIFASNLYGEVRLFDVATRNERLRLAGQKDPARLDRGRFVAVNAPLRLVAVVPSHTPGAKIRLVSFAPEGIKEFGELHGPEQEPIGSLEFSERPARLLVLTRDRLAAWDAQTKKAVREVVFSRPLSGFSFLAASPDGRLAALATADEVLEDGPDRGAVYVWRMAP